jgi:GNAT superfamily N-acetyltransferase
MQDSNMTWAAVRCPPIGELAQELSRAAQLVAEPWRSYALCCLKEDIVSSSQTYIITGTRRNLGIVASTWLSLPDEILLSRRPSWAFIFNVSVLPSFRGQGLGSELVRMACLAAQRYKAAGIMLATGDTNLKKNFYYRLGFRAVAQDPWLMALQFPNGVDSVRSQRLPHNRQLVRRAASHDLGTVQSICAQPHWVCTEDRVQLSAAHECEETFCERFVNYKTIDFLIASALDGLEFVSWLRQDGGVKFQQCVLVDQSSEDELHRVCREAIRLRARFELSRREFTRGVS